MMNLSVKLLRNTALSLIVLCASIGVQAESGTSESEIREEMSKFSEENTKLREEHIEKMRELHLKHINELYDRKLAHGKETSEMWKQLKPGDKKANKELGRKIKAKQKEFREEQEKFKKDFLENVLKQKNQEFHTGMKKRLKEMKGKHHKE